MMRATTLASLALVGLSACATSASSTDLSDLQSRVAALESDNADLTARVAALESANADNVTSSGLTATLADYITSASLSTTLADYETTSDLADTLAGYAEVTNGFTLNVGPSRDYPSVAAALASLDRYRISPRGLVTISVDEGTYSVDSPNTIFFRHPNGDRITVVGNGNVVFTHTGDGPAMTVMSGYQGGTVRDITLSGDGNGTGILVADDASLAGYGLTAEGFAIGFQAYKGGALYLQDAVAIDDNWGYAATIGGVLTAPSSSYSGTGTGYRAEGGGVIYASSSTVTGTGGQPTGFLAMSHGYINASWTSVSNASKAVDASGSSMVDASAAHFYANDLDLVATEDSYVTAPGAADKNDGDTGYTSSPNSSPTATADGSVYSAVYVP